MRSVGGLLREQTPEPHYHHTQQIKNIYYGGVDPKSKIGNQMNIIASNFFNMFKIAYLPYKKPELSNI